MAKFANILETDRANSRRAHQQAGDRTRINLFVKMKRSTRSAR